MQGLREPVADGVPFRPDLLPVCIAELQHYMQPIFSSLSTVVCFGMPVFHYLAVPFTWLLLLPGLVYFALEQRNMSELSLFLTTGKRLPPFGTK